MCQANLRLFYLKQRRLLSPVPNHAICLCWRVSRSALLLLWNYRVMLIKDHQRAEYWLRIELKHGFWEQDISWGNQKPVMSRNIYMLWPWELCWKEPLRFVGAGSSRRYTMAQGFHTYRRSRGHHIRASSVNHPSIYQRQIFHIEDSIR